MSQGKNPVAPRIGRILVKVPNNPQFSGYLSKKLTASSLQNVFPGTFPVTTDVGESLEVKLLSTETRDLWRLGVKDLPGVEYLAAYPCGGSDFRSICGAIIGVQRAPIGRSGESTTYASTLAHLLNHQYNTDVWELGSQGALTLRWPDHASGTAAVPITVYESTYLGILEEYVIKTQPGFQKGELVFVESSS